MMTGTCLVFLSGLTDITRQLVYILKIHNVPKSSKFSLLKTGLSFNGPEERSFRKCERSLPIPLR